MPTAEALPGFNAPDWLFILINLLVRLVPPAALSGSDAAALADGRSIRYETDSFAVLFGKDHRALTVYKVALLCVF